MVKSMVILETRPDPFVSMRCHSVRVGDMTPRVSHPPVPGIHTSSVSPLLMVSTLPVETNTGERERPGTPTSQDNPEEERKKGDGEGFPV